MHAELHEKLKCCRVGAQVCLDAYARSMAACLCGFGPATTCAASWLQLQRPSTRGLMVHGLLRLHLGRSQPSVRTWWLCGCRLSLEVAQVVAMPRPRKHAAMLHCMP